MCFVAKDVKNTFLIVEQNIVCQSCVFEAIVDQKRRDSNIEGKNEGTYAVICVGMGRANVMGKQCCVKYYPYSL